MHPDFREARIEMGRVRSEDSLASPPTPKPVSVWLLLLRFLPLRTPTARYLQLNGTLLVPLGYQLYLVMYETNRGFILQYMQTARGFLRWNVSLRCVLHCSHGYKHPKGYLHYISFRVVTNNSRVGVCMGWS